MCTYPCIPACFTHVHMASMGSCSFQLSRLLCPWDSPCKNTGVSCHALFWGIFPTQGSNRHLLCLLHWQLGSLSLEPPGKPLFIINKCLLWMNFPGGSDGKASAYNAEDPGSIPGLGRSPAEGNGNPPQCSCLENPMDWGAWLQSTDYSPWGCKEWDTAEQLHFHLQWMKDCYKNYSPGSLTFLMNSAKEWHFFSKFPTQFSAERVT